MDNSTPANVLLIDKFGMWDISVQGSPSRLSDKSLEIVYRAIANENEFVRTNRVHGFSCACLTVENDLKRRIITKVYQSEQLPLKRCLEDISITPYIPLPFK